MRIIEITESVKGSPTHKLKSALKAAKQADKPLNYDSIDRMMKRISKDCGITPDELHDKFKDATGVIPDDWIKKQKKTDESSLYLGPTEKVKINKGGWQIPLNKKGFGA